MGGRPPPQPEGTTPGGRSAASASLNDEPHRSAAPSFSVSPEAIRETNRHLRSIPPDDVAAHGGFGTGPLALLFFKDGGVRFAVDREQGRAVHVLDEGTDGGLQHYQEALGGRHYSESRENPLVLRLRTKPPTSILVDEVEAITEISTSDLRPLPRLAESRIKALGLWAVAIVGGELVLMVDFHRLPNRPSLS